MSNTFTKSGNEQYFPELFTWRDLIVELADWAGVAASSQSERKLRTATLNAVRDLCGRRDWRFLFDTQVVPIQPLINLYGYYDHTGGASERLFTITDGTPLPSDIALYNVVIRQATYEIAKSTSSDTFNLTLRANPNADYGTALEPATVALVKIAYPCPGDFVKAHDPKATNRNRSLIWISPDEYDIMSMQRPQYGEPRYWTVTPHERMYAQRAVKVYPFPSVFKNVSIHYRKVMRPLRISGFASGEYGTFSLTHGTNGNRATVSGVTVSSALVGSIFRCRADTNTPENIDGRYPYKEQAVIVDVNIGSNYVYLDRFLEDDYTAKACVISDPVDVPQYFLNALKTDCQYHYARLANKGPEIWGPLRQQLGDDLTFAAEGDAGYVIGSGIRYPQHFQDDDGSPINVGSV